jgi:hypothetical protein
MLRGCKTPGPAFAWQNSARSFQVVEGVHIPELSPTMLFTTLHHFAQLGTIATRFSPRSLTPPPPTPHPLPLNFYQYTVPTHPGNSQSWFSSGIL